MLALTGMATTTSSPVVSKILAGVLKNQQGGGRSSRGRRTMPGRSGDAADSDPSTDASQSSSAAPASSGAAPPTNGASGGRKSGTSAGGSDGGGSSDGGGESVAARRAKRRAANKQGRQRQQVNSTPGDNGTGRASRRSTGNGGRNRRSRSSQSPAGSPGTTTAPTTVGNGATATSASTGRASPGGGVDTSESHCFVCGEAGTLIMCDKEQCDKVYHTQCIAEGDDSDDDDWYCPRHTCAHEGCSGPSASTCDRCPSGFCDKHSEQGMAPNPPSKQPLLVPTPRPGAKLPPTKPLSSQRVCNVCSCHTGPLLAARILERVLCRIALAFQVQPYLARFEDADRTVAAVYQKATGPTCLGELLRRVRCLQYSDARSLLEDVASMTSVVKQVVGPSFPLLLEGASTLQQLIEGKLGYVAPQFDRAARRGTSSERRADAKSFATMRDAAAAAGDVSRLPLRPELSGRDSYARKTRAAWEAYLREADVGATPESRAKAQDMSDKVLADARLPVTLGVHNGTVRGSARHDGRHPFGSEEDVTASGDRASPLPPHLRMLDGGDKRLYQRRVNSVGDPDRFAADGASSVGASSSLSLGLAFSGEGEDAGRIIPPFPRDVTPQPFDVAFAQLGRKPSLRKFVASKLPQVKPAFDTFVQDNAAAGDGGGAADGGDSSDAGMSDDDDAAAFEAHMLVSRRRARRNRDSAGAGAGAGRGSASASGVSSDRRHKRQRTGDSDADSALAEALPVFAAAKMRRYGARRLEGAGTLRELRAAEPDVSGFRGLSQLLPPSGDDVTAELDRMSQQLRLSLITNARLRELWASSQRTLCQDVRGAVVTLGEGRAIEYRAANKSLEARVAELEQKLLQAREDIEDRDRTIASQRQRLAGAPSNDAAARAQSSDVDMNAGAGAGAGAGASSASAAAAGGLLGLIGRAATSMSPAKPKAPTTGSRQA